MLNQAPNTAAPAASAPTDTAPVTAAPVVDTKQEQVPAAEPAKAPEAQETKEEKEAKEDPKMASKFAALAKREQKVRMQETALKEKLAKISEYEMNDKLFNENPLEWLSKKGVTFDKLTQLALNDGKKPPEMQIKELEERLDRERREREERETEAAKKRVEAQRQEFFEGVTGFLKENPDRFELCLAEGDGVPELIFEVMNVHKEKTGRILPLEQAAEAVEKHFESLLDEKFVKLNKLKSKFVKEEKPAATTGTQPVTATVEKKESPTLTNTQASTVPTPSTQKALTIDESKREAAKLLKWV